MSLNRDDNGKSEIPQQIDIWLMRVGLINYMWIDVSFSKHKIELLSFKAIQSPKKEEQSVINLMEELLSFPILRIRFTKRLTLIDFIFIFVLSVLELERHSILSCSPRNRVSVVFAPLKLLVFFFFFGFCYLSEYSVSVLLLLNFYYFLEKTKERNKNNKKNYSYFAIHRMRYFRYFDCSCFCCGSCLNSSR